MFRNALNCGLFQMNITERHLRSVHCKKWTKVFQKSDTFAENQGLVAETVFDVNGVPVETVKEFKYLGRISSDDDSEGPCVDRNLDIAQKAWGSALDNHCPILDIQRHRSDKGH
jgi:hypothetical protein